MEKMRKQTNKQTHIIIKEEHVAMMMKLAIKAYQEDAENQVGYDQLINTLATRRDTASKRWTAVDLSSPLMDLINLVLTRCACEPDSSIIQPSS